MPSSIDLLKISSKGARISLDIDFYRLLLMLSYPLLDLFHRLFMSVSISWWVVGWRNILVSCCFNPLRYSLCSREVQFCSWASFSPIVEKNSLNELVIESLLCFRMLSTLKDSMLFCLLFSFPSILFISCQSFFPFCLYSLHLSCR